MKKNSRLDGAISVLKAIVERYNKQETFKISSDKTIIYNNTSQLWGTIFYLAFLILLPTGLLIYYLLFDKSNSSIFWLALIDILFGFDLYKMVRGNAILTIDFNKKVIQVDNNNGVFKHIFKPKFVSFDSLSNIELKEKSVSGKVSNAWLRLTATLEDNTKIIFTDFSTVFPESMIADKVKFLFEVIIWTEKQNANVTA